MFCRSPGSPCDTFRSENVRQFDFRHILGVDRRVRSRAREGAVIGAVFGAAFGVFVREATRGLCESSDCPGPVGPYVITGAITCGFFGLMIGTTRAEWQPVHGGDGVPPN